MSLRMTETKREERTQRKSYATFTPMGPWITTADEVPDPSAITLKAWRNEELRQDACLKDLIVDVPELISRASHVVPLDVGDVYATGSPAGVGQVQPGDQITLESPQLGTMTLDVATRPW
jgi:2-keto-4-pentenoate hydratase/2-oxohepta-3-ene-1,7-dioic acid hydratase in catechol pathway